MATQQGLLTAEEFAALPHEGLRLELIKGELIAMPPTHGNHGVPAMRLSGLLTHYILTNHLGQVYAAETGFLIAENPDTVRAPDFAFIQSSRVTPETVAPTWVPVIPDLVVEVVSTGDRETEVASKTRMWLDAGVRLAWVVYPARREIVIHRTDSATTLAETDTLTGEDVVPGFELPVADVFGS
jgi:Uma2 family endonuclease